MTSSRTWRRGRFGGLFLGCALSSSFAQAQAPACGAVRLDATLGQVASRWQEHDNQRRELLLETGNLATLGLGVQAECFGLDWQASLHSAQGRRDYAGRSSTGAAIQSSSGIEQTELRLELRRDVAPQLWLAGRLGYQVLNRTLAGVGAVQGYPEQYRYWRGAIGAGHRLWQGARWQLQGEAWVGGGPAGRMTLTLPADDPATLTLGNSAHAALGLEWRSDAATEPAAGWSWRLRLDHMVEQIEAGSPQILTRNGGVVGAALQPKTRISSTTFGAGLRYRF